MLDVRCWTLDVCFCFGFRDIPRPDVDPDQFAPRRLGNGGVTHGAGDPDAAAEKRRARRGIWWGGDGKYFRCTNHKRAREIHGLARGDFFRSDVCVVDPLCAQERGRECAAARTDENASGRTGFSGAGSFSTFAGFFRRA